MNSDRNAIVLKQGETGRFGGVEFLVDHDSIFGSEDYKYVKICLYDFRRGRGEQHPAFPKFLREFNALSDVDDLCNVSTHCREARDEITQLIELAGNLEYKIIRKDSPCSSRMCLTEAIKSRVSLR